MPKKCHLAKEKLKTEALSKRITHEKYDDFVMRVKRTLTATPVETIDNIIRSMNKIIDMVIAAKGQRIKY